MSQWHCVQQVVIRSVSDYTLMQGQCISKSALALDPEHLFCPDLWVLDLSQCVALGVFEI